jgi:UDP-N-acetylglucosamine transferase subunit ALG13
MRDAAAVVCHGGPGTIMECRSLGLLPIVVPRQARLGEHVDDHQIRFARRMATTGGIHLAETEAQLHELLERVFVDPAAFRSEGVAPQLTATIRRFGELVDSLVAGVGERRRSRNRRRRQHAEGT